jgi:hypothetical protein
LKYLFLVATVLFFNNGIAKSTKSYEDVDSDTKKYIRTTFYAGVENEAKAEELKAFIEKKYGTILKSMPPFIVAYLGASETLLAKHASNPLTKLDLLNSGLDKIALALKKQPKSLEFRFMRFSILHYLPFFLGHGSERDEDLAIVFDLLFKRDYSELDKKTQIGIVNFLLESGRLDKTQTGKIKVLLK